MKAIVNVSGPVLETEVGKEYVLLGHTKCVCIKSGKDCSEVEYIDRKTGKKVGKLVVNYWLS